MAGKMSLSHWKQPETTVFSWSLREITENRCFGSDCYLQGINLMQQCGTEETELHYSDGPIVIQMKP